MSTVSLLSFAVTAPDPGSGAEPSNLATMASMMGGLLLVLVLIFALAYVVRRLNLAPASNGVLKTLAVTPMGQREKLVLVELAGQQYLLGVTAQQVNLIDKLATPVTVEKDSFASRLRQANSKQS